MGGFEHHYLTNITLLRSLFNSETTEFLILKELIQNADDSGATVVTLGCSPGLENAVHPLLSGPALYAVNDGELKANDARALKNLGLSTKGGDSSTVGKFGLGLKSVFYMGEVYFFADARIGSEVAWSSPHFDVLNPWSSSAEAHHPSWDSFTPSDRELMLDHLNDLGVPPGFVVWVPLRRERDCLSELAEATGETVAVMPEYFGDRPFAISQETIRQLETTLPLLGSVEAISVHASPNRPKARQVFMRDGDHRTSRLDRMLPSTERLSGKIQEFPGTGQADRRYEGFEALVSSPELTNLQASGLWPVTNVTEATRTFQKRDPSIPHGAAIWQITPAARERGSLTIQWSVFLPVETEVSTPLTGGHNFTLTLHGYFFLRPDRKSIFRWDDTALQSTPTSQDDLRRHWNGTLAGTATLPFVLAGLAEITRELPEADVTALTWLLKTTGTFFREHRTSLTREHQWVRQLRAEGPVWTLLTSHDRTLAFPGDPLVFEVFPRLADTCVQWNVVDSGAPNFTAPGQLSYRWPRVQAEALVSSVDFARTLLEEPLLSALQKGAEILEAHRFADVLRARLRTVFANADFRKLNAHRVAIAALLKTLLPRQVLGLPEGFTAALRDLVLGADLQVLIVPAGFVPASEAPEDRPVLPVQDARILLHFAQEAGAGLVELLQFVRHSVENDQAFETAADSLALIPVSQRQGQDADWFTLQEVREMVEQRLVFRRQGSEGRIMASLQAALPESTVRLIAGNILDALPGLEVVRPSMERILETVQAAPVLGTIKQRVDLLKFILEESRSVLDALVNRPALRYLLHGHPDHRADVGTPLLIGSRDSMAWRTAVVAASTSPQGWTVVGHRVAFLNDIQLDRLNIQSCDTDGPLETLLKQSPHTFPGDQVIPGDRRALQLSLKDTDLLKALPIHERLDGSLGPITPDTFIEGGFEVDNTLELLVTLLKAFSDDRELTTQLRRLAPPLSPVQAWERLIMQPEPWRSWPTLLKALDAYPNPSIVPKGGRETAWLPLKNSGGCAPRRVLRLAGRPEAMSILQQLRDDAHSETPVETDLLPDLTNHPAWPKAGRVFPNEDETKDLLNDLLEKAREFHIGTFRGPVLTWQSALKGAPAEIFPFSRLLSELPASMQEAALKAAARPMPAERIGKALTFLHQQSLQAQQTDAPAIAAVYSSLLDDLRFQGQVSAVLPTLFLLNRSGQWQKADDLTREGPQLEDRYVLLPAHAVALFGAVESMRDALEVQVPPSGQLSPELQLKNSTQTLYSHVRNWEQASLPREQLGAFLGLLDGNPQLHKYAEGYLGGVDLSVMRERAFRGVPRDHLPKGFAEYRDVMQKVRLLVQVTKADTTQVPNLLGEPLTVPFKDDAALTSLFVERLHGRHFSDQGVYYIPVDLKMVDANRTDINLPELLLGSLKWIYKQYGSVPPYVDEQFSAVVNSSQVNVAATQRRLLKAASQTWGRQLGLAKSSGVGRILDRIEVADRKAEQAREQKAEESERRAEADIATMRGELKHLVEQDCEAQQTLLAGLRKKIEEQQYTADSVLFELLQNADDALVEWQGMTGEVEEARGTFTLTTSKTCWQVLHQGRPVNLYAHGEFDGRERGFDADLEKMLTLMSSDKGAGTTGHFGLGFKSVFLVSDRPTVLSGQLCFTVLGGVYPVTPALEEVEALRSARSEGSPLEVRDGTLIDLPLLDAGRTQAAAARFLRLAPYSLIFTRAVRRLQVAEGKTTSLTSWHERTLANGVAHGVLQSGKGQPWEALVLRTPQLALVLPLSQEGIGRLETDVPNIWVTAPTGENLQLNFMVNAAFPIDPGRAQLARNEEHQHQLMRQWAPALGDALVELEQLTHNLTSLKLPQATRYDFWLSLWRTLASPFAGRESGGAAALKTLSVLLWGTAGAMTALSRKLAVVPSQLTDDDRVLVRAGDSKLIVVEFDTTVLVELARQKLFRKTYPAGRLIHRSVRAEFEALGLPATKHSLSLLQALKVALPDSRITPENALWLTRVLSADRLKALQDEEAGSEWIATLTFLTLDGQARKAAQLLTGKADAGSDEADRFPFVPDSAKLSDLYPAASLQLFRLLRGTPPTQHTAEWLVTAPSSVRAAALKYLCSLSPRSDLAEAIRRSAAGTWLDPATLREQEEIVALDLKDQFDLLRLMDAPSLMASKTLASLLGHPEGDWEDDGIFDAADPEDEDESDVLSEVPTTPPRKDAMEQLHRWWTVHGPAFVKRYEGRIFPDGHPFPVQTDPSGSQDRQAWLALLMLGSLQSMGRVKPEQHAGFLRLCRTRGWLDVFGSRPSDDARWMGVLRGYLRNDPEYLQYFHWMRGYISFYQLGHWLDEYIEIFAQADKYPAGLTLSTILAPGSNPLLQGSGLEAPPLAGTLGVGGPFIIRELLRAGVLKNQALHGFAYVPTRKIRLLMGQLMGYDLPDGSPGETSKLIHTFLVEKLGAQRATFGGHFDLALQALVGFSRDDTEALKVQESVLGRPLYGGHTVGVTR